MISDFNLCFIQLYITQLETQVCRSFRTQVRKNILAVIIFGAQMPCSAVWQTVTLTMLNADIKTQAYQVVLDGPR